MLDFMFNIMYQQFIRKIAFNKFVSSIILSLVDPLLSEIENGYRMGMKSSPAKHP